VKYNFHFGVYRKPVINGGRARTHTQEQAKQLKGAGKCVTAIFKVKLINWRRDAQTAKTQQLIPMAGPIALSMTLFLASSSEEHRL